MPVSTQSLRVPIDRTRTVINFPTAGIAPPINIFFVSQGGYWFAMKGLRPLGDRILVKRVKEEERTKGGIIIPDTAKEKPQEGKIVAVGKGKYGDDGKLIPIEVKAGDKILFGKYSGSEFKLEGEDLLILREDDILGIIE